MPGIFGICSFIDDPSLLFATQSMQTFLKHRNALISDAIFQDGAVYAGRCHTGITDTQPQPAIIDDIFIWLDGEFYNQGDFPIKKNDGDSDALLLAKNYQSDRALGFMNRVDGFFSTVIYDRPQKKILLCTDRYGFQHLHWTQFKNYFAWATEYKAFLALPGFMPSIDLESMQSFFAHGYIRGNRTWFNDVSLIPPSTIMSYDMKTRQMSSLRYWNWSEIKAIEGNINIEEIAEEWGRRFIAAVEARSRPREKTGIALSGGLDSRAILAALSQKSQAVFAYTYGKKGCDDIRFARQAARVKRAAHSIYEIDTPKWLRANCAAVWCADGEIGVLDALGSEFIDAASQKMSVSLNGMGGDPIHGGSLLDAKDEREFILSDRYEDEDRRWIRPGFRLVESFCLVRMPFYDNPLIELTMSIPENLRKDSFLFHKMLLYNFPEYFQTIPWQKTGAPITYSRKMTRALAFIRKIKSKCFRLTYQWGIPVSDSADTINKRERTIIEPGRTFFAKLFSDENAFYPEYIDKDRVHWMWKRHIMGKDATTLINRYATFEIWLRQVFTQSHRPRPDNFPFVDIS